MERHAIKKGKDEYLEKGFDFSKAVKIRMRKS